MLPRREAFRSTAPRLRRGEDRVRPVSASLQRWLTAPGSLTARLRAHGQVDVVVVFQGSARLWPIEARDLRQRNGHVREVILRIDGRPAVWARSTTPHRALRGPWKALRGLGTRPLAELLFSRRHVCREPLVSHHPRRHSLAVTHLHRQWAGLMPGQPAHEAPNWARSSVFWRSGQPLRVLEVFAPWVTALNAHELGRRR